MELVDQLTRKLVGVTSQGSDDAESPGSDGASPYLPALSRLTLPGAFQSFTDKTMIGSAIFAGAIS
jgi:hypothetical protein